MIQPHASQNGYSLAPGVESSYSDDVQPDVHASGNVETGSQTAADVHLASTEEKRRLWWRNAVINVIFIGSWFLFATLLSVYNKWMFSPDHFGFPYPMFVTTFHMFIQFGLAACLRHFFPERFKPALSPNKEDYGRKAVPCAMTTGLDIGFSNLSLKTVTLSFYTMCKSSSLIFVLIFAFLFRLERFSWRLIGVILLIVAGVVLMVATETHFVLGGFLLVISASALGGLRWSLTQILLKNKKMGMDNPAATIFWLSPVMGITLLVVSAVIEQWWPVFSTPFFDGLGATIYTVLYLIFPGVLAFCMVLSEFYILQRAGMLPMSIAGIAKEVTTISISAWLFGDELTPLNITGVAITVCGIILFTFHRYRKSIESTVPVDAHGNPIEEDDVETDEGRVGLLRPSQDMLHGADHAARSSHEHPAVCHSLNTAPPNYSEFCAPQSR
ncbi:TPT-domain-containing protein [Gloeophyllum trabeum ATCC 11539]|uniref:TPT-domain-containing protein n=1 Tax=Gloeophyllum trabeum (strain ATCC 11539 / FP-39264 / Madison 617) TaxID=670483 RepID=S7RWG9_GLOTA|nr:TPT-domain-containing protein [Gloeophyllum trabeum ATCC 11539]EPQ57669.1 TPT-domain-containing protein [Gloeophyllum trabeum ATCC 11539]